MGWALGYFEFLILRILFAAAQAASVPAIAGVMADCFTQQNRSRAVAVYLLSAPFSIVVVGWVGGTLADVFDWRIMVFSFAGLGVVVVAALCLLFREPERVDVQEGGLFGQSPDGSLPRAGGHESDVRKRAVVHDSDLSLGVAGSSHAVAVLERR